MESLDKFIRCDSVKEKWMMEILGDLLLPPDVPRFGGEYTTKLQDIWRTCLCHWYAFPGTNLTSASVCVTNLRSESGCVWRFYHGWPDLPLRDKPETHLENPSPAWNLWTRWTEALENQFVLCSASPWTPLPKGQAISERLRGALPTQPLTLSFLSSSLSRANWSLSQSSWDVSGSNKNGARGKEREREAKKWEKAGERPTLNGI